VCVCVCVCVCVLVGLSRVYVLILSFVLSSWAVVGALWPYCPAHCGESLLFVIAVNAWFSAKCVCDERVRLSVRAYVDEARGRECAVCDVRVRLSVCACVGV